MAIVIQTVDGVVVNKFDVEAEGLSFGRSVDNHIQIDDSAISTKHAEILLDKYDEKREIYLIQDLNSTNGTFVNDKKVVKQQLHHKDEIRVGWNIFTFFDENERDLEKTDKIKKSWVPGVYFKEK